MRIGSGEIKGMFQDAVHHLIVQPDDGIAPILKTIEGAKTSLDIKMFQFTDPVLIEAVIAALHQH